MITIHKYPLLIIPVQSISLSERHALLHVGLDPGGIMCLWAEVDTIRDSMTVDFYVVGTGHEMPKTRGSLKHLGSVVQRPFVWHVYTDK